MDAAEISTNGEDWHHPGAKWYSSFKCYLASSLPGQRIKIVNSNLLHWFPSSDTLATYTLLKRTPLMCRVGVLEPAERYFLRGFHR